MKTKKYLKQFALLVLMLVISSCGSQTRAQNETDQSLIRTQAAQTIIAELSVTETPVEPTLAPTLQPGTRDNPVPLGQSLELVKDNDTFFKVTILEVIRGDQAWQMIYQTNMFNDPPEEGKEYILAKVRVEYTNSTVPNKTLSISTWNFGTTSNNQVFEELFIVNPSPELDVELYPGGVGEGYISGIVFKDDAGALIHYTEMFSDIKFFFAIQ